MSYVDTHKVKETFETIINTGRSARKKPLMKLGELTTPANALAKMTSDDFASLDVLNAYKGISANSYVAKMANRF